MAQVDVTRIASNIGALNALNSLQTINQKLALHQTRLSTGKRINSAADDPAGLTIATKMLARSEGMKVAVDNIGDASNMLSVAESGLSKMSDIMITMRSKAQQAASDTLGGSERAAIQTQLESYAAQLDDIVKETKWNGVQLLDGTVNKRFQTGVDDGEYTNWQLSQKFTASSDSGGLGVSRDYAAAGVSDWAKGSATSFDATTPVTISAVFTGRTALTTGDYTEKIVAKGSATTGTGTINATLARSNANLSLSGVAVGGGTELTSGTYTLSFSANNSATTTGKISGTFTDTLTGATTTFTNKTYVSASATTVDLGVGVQLSFGAGLISGVATSDSMSAEYIKSNQVKMSLLDGSGLAVSVDRSGTYSATDYSSTSFYATQGATFDTGRGVTLKLNTMANINVGESGSFNYHTSGNNVVDVSSAVRASAYMADVETALGTVSSNMANLGSLMARLGFKSEQVANAQVNVEGAYSRIMNANMAEEQMNASKYTILQQTAVAMLAQANQAPQSLLTLFR